MNILLIGDSHFKAAFELQGHAVTAVRGRDAEQLDLKLFKSDIIIVHESLGMRELPHGIERACAPTVFYAVDIHLNFLWHREYAQLFDFVFVSQKDFVKQLKYCNAYWLPWSIDPAIYYDYGVSRNQDIVFIGTLDDQRLKRRNILCELSKSFRVNMYGADPRNRLTPRQMAYVYSSAKIVLNESILGEITFRTFEATACGAMLLTERVANGLGELFLDGEEIVTYNRLDLIEKAAFYLQNHCAREAVAGRGMHRARQCYTTDQAAKRILDVAGSMHANIKHNRPNELLRLAKAKTLFFCSIKFPRRSRQRLKRAELVLKSFCNQSTHGPDTNLYLALTYFAQGCRQRACALLKSLSHYPEMTHLYCMASMACGDIESALAHASTALDKDNITADNIMSRLALLYEQYGMPFYPGSPSLEDLPLNAVECHVHCATAEGFGSAARLACEAGAYGAAVELLLHAKNMQPAETKIRLQLANVYLKVYDTDAALNEFAEAVAADELSGIADLQDSERHIIQGVIDLRQGDHRGAIKHFRCAGSASAHLRLGQLYLLINEPHRALECGQKAQSLLPYDRSVRRLLRQAGNRYSPCGAQAKNA